MEVSTSVLQAEVIEQLSYQFTLTHDSVQAKEKTLRH